MILLLNDMKSFAMHPKYKMENVKLLSFGISASGVWTTVATKYNKEFLTQENCQLSSNYARGLIKFRAPSSVPA